MRYLSADFILPIASEPIENGVLQIDESGKILNIGIRDDFPSNDIQVFPGILMPGFINTHCHLELSHMKGLCATGTGLIPFISSVVKLRDFEKDVIQEYIKIYDQKMYASGIQAVGDISNKTDTALQKNKSQISYYTFVEMFDFMQDSLFESTVENYRNVFKNQAQDGQNKKSFVPHAPYSVSERLFDFINNANPSNATISVHNQETHPENAMFLTGKSAFDDFYKGFGFNLNHFKHNKKTAIHYLLENLNPKAKNIFVHNTLTTEEDIKAAHNWSDNCYWATCPNANLYIENRLPNYKNFINTKAKVTIGTDSIMSNWELSIWEEVKTIKKFQSYVPLLSILKWATQNGANALGYEHLGSFEKGKNPGVVNIDLKWKGNETNVFNTFPKRII